MSPARPITLGIALAIAIVVAAGLPGAAAAHEGGKAEPRIAARLGGSGLNRNLVVRLTDIDGGGAISGASVVASASMSQPPGTKLEQKQLDQTQPGTYEGRIELPEPAVWTIEIAVSGEDIVPASATLGAKIERAPPSAVEEPHSQLSTLPSHSDDTLASTDYRAMAILWLHSLAALGWIVGVAAMVVALASPPAILAAGPRARLSRWYRRRGVWLHWSLVPVIVATGIYNMLKETPFSLAWTPSEFRNLDDIPYGSLYETTLIVKLSLFAVLLITATQLLWRTIRDSREPEPTPAGAIATLRAGLGTPGLVYLACIPLILAAATALRYVHILSHVAAG